MPLLSLSEYLSMMANHLRHLVHHVELHPVCLKQLQRQNAPPDIDVSANGIELRMIKDVA